jgi:MFS family permease
MVLLAGLVALDGPIELIVALTIVATCFSAFFSPAIGAYLPSLVRDEADLGPANSAWSSLDNLAFVIGPALAGLLIAVGGLTLAFVLNALSFLVIAIVLWRLPPSRANRDGSPDDPAMSATNVRHDRTLRVLLRRLAAPISGLMVIGVVAGFVFGGLGVLTVVLAFDVLGGDESATGALNAATGVGGVLGAVASGALVLRRRLGPPLLFGGLVSGGSVVVLGQTGSLTVALVAMAVGAAGGLLVDVVTTTLFQRMIPDELRGRVLGLIETVGVVAYAAGSFAVPVLAVRFGVWPVLGGSGIAIIVATAAGAVLMGDRLTEAPRPDDPRSILARVPIFAGLAPASLETAIERADVVPMRGGDVVIRQGDEADRFYVIHAGAVEVTQSEATGDTRILRRMAAGEFFGEIGLLSGVPRTATVTAVEDGTLIALDRDAFLELVSARAGLTSRLLDLHRGVAAHGS